MYLSTTESSDQILDLVDIPSSKIKHHHINIILVTENDNDNETETETYVLPESHDSFIRFHDSFHAEISSILLSSHCYKAIIIFFYYFILYSQSLNFHFIYHPFLHLHFAIFVFQSVSN